MASGLRDAACAAPPREPAPEVPDRAATASAPPDLEISSRSLFAFKADYSGFFTDIRQDELYPSFYHHQQREAAQSSAVAALPLPLAAGDHSSRAEDSSSPPREAAPTAALSESSLADVLTAAGSAGRAHDSSGRPTAMPGQRGEFSESMAGSEAADGMGSLEPSAGPTPTSASNQNINPIPQKTPAHAHHHHPHHHHLVSDNLQHPRLTRHDSESSVDDLIFRAASASSVHHNLHLSAPSPVLAVSSVATAISASGPAQSTSPLSVHQRQAGDRHHDSACMKNMSSASSAPAMPSHPGQVGHHSQYNPQSYADPTSRPLHDHGRGQAHPQRKTGIGAQSHTHMLPTGLDHPQHSPSESSLGQAGRLAHTQPHGIGMKLSPEHNHVNKNFGNDQSFGQRSEAHGNLQNQAHRSSGHQTARPTVMSGRRSHQDELNVPSHLDPNVQSSSDAIWSQFDQLSLGRDDNVPLNLYERPLPSSSTGPGPLSASAPFLVEHGQSQSDTQSHMVRQQQQYLSLSAFQPSGLHSQAQAHSQAYLQSEPHAQTRVHTQAQLQGQAFAGVSTVTSADQLDIRRRAQQPQEQQHLHGPPHQVHLHPSFHADGLQGPLYHLHSSQVQRHLIPHPFNPPRSNAKSNGSSSLSNQVRLGAPILSDYSGSAVRTPAPLSILSYTASASSDGSVDYLNAQAAAAAAAAAAAVYQNGGGAMHGVHMAGSSLLPNGPAGHGISPIMTSRPSGGGRATNSSAGPGGRSGTQTYGNGRGSRSNGKGSRNAPGIDSAYDSRSLRTGNSSHDNSAGIATLESARVHSNAFPVYVTGGVHVGGPFGNINNNMLSSGFGSSVGASNGGGGGATGDLSHGKLVSFNDIIGRAEELARDQHGCRFLQTKLEEGNPSYINAIFEECYEKFVDLMTDPFGNYLCQKLFEYCNDAQRLALVERCAPSIPRVSTNMHGTRAVQRMVECLSTPEQVRAVCNSLAPAAVSLMKDINGNHVIQRCLHRMELASNQFVYDAVANNCFELATHRHGCCVMQRCMDYASPAQRDQLAQQINANALPLVQNAFGNYVVQYVLELNEPAYTAEIIRRLRGHVAELSTQKFSSNVIEKSLQLGDRETRRDLIEELIADVETMRQLLHDAYGNYVIQRALQMAESPQLEQICEAIRPHLNALKQSPYGKRIQAKILKRMPKCIPAGNGMMVPSAGPTQGISVVDPRQQPQA